MFVQKTHPSLPELEEKNIQVVLQVSKIQTQTANENGASCTEKLYSPQKTVTKLCKESSKFSGKLSSVINFLVIQAYFCGLIHY